MIDLKGKVLLITGGGGGIGAACVRRAAALGADIVLHDVTDRSSGKRLAEELGPDRCRFVAADLSEGGTVPGLWAEAIGWRGRIDVLVNNAGIIRWQGMPAVDADALNAHFAVHVGGSFNTTRAAWPHMVEQQYGRVVNTTSSGIFGLRENLSYATAKAAIIGLTHSLMTEGAAHNIKVNAIAPAAMTRMAGRSAEETVELDNADPSTNTAMDAALVSPIVAFLAHEDCPVSGEIYAAGGGRFARIFVAQTQGYVNASPTVEDVAQHWAEVNDETGYNVPADLMGWSAIFLEHLYG